MATIKNFRDLIVWRKAHELVLFTYRVSKMYPKEERFSLTSQTRRAALSVATNIVEGFKKRSKKDSINFYNISEGSLEELKYEFLVAKDLGYLKDDDYGFTVNSCDEVGRLLNGWIESQRKAVQST